MLMTKQQRTYLTFSFHHWKRENLNSFLREHFQFPHENLNFFNVKVFGFRMKNSCFLREHFQFPREKQIFFLRENFTRKSLGATP